MLKYYRVKPEDETFVEKVLEDGSYTELSASSQEVLDWIEAGNTLHNNLPVRSKEEDEIFWQEQLGELFVSGHTPSGLYPAELPNS